MNDSYSILIIEDEKNILDFMSRTLKANGYKTTTVTSGKAGLSIINSQCPDLILLDLGLPDMDGNDIIASVREWTSCPIIVISARTGEHDKVAALDLGADDYITKPFGTSELLARIRVALRKSNQIPEEKKEKTAGSDTKKVVVVDEKALARMYQYIQRNYGKTWLSESEEKSRNYQLCRGIHSDCSLYYTEGVLKNPVGKYYQLSYAQKQKDKNLHAYYDQHRAVRQNISLLYQELKKAMLLQEDQSFADADHGILQPARMWKVGRSQNADLFQLEQRRNSLDFVVDILVDASGSQRPRQENVTLQTYILAETLSRLHIPFRVMSFCTFWDYTILHRMRDYDDPREKNSNIFEYITSSNNRDGLAVKAAGIDLLKRQEDRKLLILLSDGKPYDVLVNRPNARNPKPYRDDYALHDTATEVRRLRQQGVSVLGVFVGEETELMAEQKIFGKDFAYARDIRNFSHMVGSYLRRKIEE